MKKNICIFNDSTGLKCNHPDHGTECQGKCRDHVDDLEDLYIDIDDRKKTEMSY